MGKLTGVAPSLRLPLPLAERVLLHTLKGTEHLHECCIVHTGALSVLVSKDAASFLPTDLKQDNIMFDSGRSDAELRTIIEMEKPRRHPPEASLEGNVRVALSQPLPLPQDLSEALQRTYMIGDLGGSQDAIEHANNDYAPQCLRPPEIRLTGP